MMKSFLVVGLLLNAWQTHALRITPTMEYSESKDARDLFLLHIPKCAGTSFRGDARKFLPLRSSEACYEDYKDLRMAALLRDPRAHVLSQYFHCRTSDDHSYGHDFVPATFPEWIDSWSDHLSEFEQFESQPFCCYTPYNMMAARFSCGNGVSEQESHFHPEIMDVLKEKIANLSFVGLAEAYSESLCLLRIRETGQFPEECECGNKQGISKTHVTHGSQPHKTSDYHEDVLRKVDKLTAIDKALYEFGKKRFFDDIQAVENKYKKKILCRELVFNTLTEKDFDDEEGSPTKQLVEHGVAGTCRKWQDEAKEKGYPLPS